MRSTVCPEGGLAGSKAGGNFEKMVHTPLRTRVWIVPNFVPTPCPYLCYDVLRVRALKQG